MAISLLETYNQLKQYIDKNLTLAKTDLENLFIEYKTKEVGSNIDSVNTVGSSIDNVNSIATDISNVDTVANSISNVNTVSNDIDNVNTVEAHIGNIDIDATNIDNINTVGTNIDSVNTNAGSIGNINTNAINIGNINTVGSDIGNVNITANSIDNVNTYAKTYYGVATEDPTARPDGSDCLTGDLYFNSTVEKMKVFNGDTWQLATSAVNGMLKKAIFTGDGSTTDFEVDGGFDANFGQVYLNGTNVTEDVDISDGQNIKFDTAPDDEDDILGVFFGSFEVADAIATTGGDCSGDINITDDLKGVTLIDRSDNTKTYRLYVDDGNLGIEEV